MRRGVVCGLAAAGVMAAALGSGWAAGLGPKVAAHRGGAGLWPENSVLAFRNALGLGVDYVETDVHLTADGEVVIVHDPTLERTTTGRGAVHALSLAELAPVRLRARDGSVTAEPIPTLGRLLDLLQPSGVGLLVEVKVDERRRRYPGIEEKVLALLRNHAMGVRTLVMSFEPATLTRVHELDPAQRTVLLVGRGRRRGAVGAEAVARARAVGAAGAGCDFRLVDAGTVATARAAGVLLAAWTVNEESDLGRMVDLGVDIVISDRPDRALDRRRLASPQRPRPDQRPPRP